MKHNIIFICTGNSCRSQIAEGLLKNEARDKFNVYSAGSHPSRIHPASIKVMAEWGIDISNQKSEIIDKYLKEIWKMDRKQITKIFATKKEVASFLLDPKLETDSPFLAPVPNRGKIGRASCRERV